MQGDGRNPRIGQRFSRGRGGFNGGNFSRGRTQNQNGLQLDGVVFALRRAISEGEHSVYLCVTIESYIGRN